MTLQYLIALVCFAGSCHQAALAADQIFVTNEGSGDVSVIDVAAMKVVKSIPVGQQPWGVVVAPN